MSICTDFLLKNQVKIWKIWKPKNFRWKTEKKYRLFRKSKGDILRNSFRQELDCVQLRLEALGEWGTRASLSWHNFGPNSIYTVFLLKIQVKIWKIWKPKNSDGKPRKNIDFFEKVKAIFYAIRLGRNLTAFCFAWKHLVNEVHVPPYLDRILVQTQFIQFFYWKIKWILLVQ